VFKFEYHHVLKGQLKQFDCKNPRCGETVTPPDLSDFENNKFVLTVSVSYLCRKCGKVYTDKRAKASKRK
jgi:hypothetical protein